MTRAVKSELVVTSPDYTTEDWSGTTPLFESSTIHEEVSSVQARRQFPLRVRLVTTSYSKRLVLAIQSEASSTYRISPDPFASHDWRGGNPDQPLDLDEYESQPLSGDADAFPFERFLVLTDRCQPIFNDYVVTGAEAACVFYEGEAEADFRVWDA
jgi:hypothetical protein